MNHGTDCELLSATDPRAHCESDSASASGAQENRKMELLVDFADVAMPQGVAMSDSDECECLHDVRQCSLRNEARIEELEGEIAQGWKYMGHTHFAFV